MESETTVELVSIVKSKMRSPTIFEQIDEKEVPEFWGFTCPDCDDPVMVIQGYLVATWPIRCQSCEVHCSRYKRAKKMKKRVKTEFSKLKEPHVGFLTLTLPGDYLGRVSETESVVESIAQARIDLYSSWTKFWRNYLKDHCVGAYRFFEWTERAHIVQEHIDDTDPTTVSMRIHPHLHVLVLQEGKTIDIRELRTAAIDVAGFGTQLDMEWKPDVDGFNSIDYCLSYTKKDLQIDGRNRQGYGVFHGNRKRSVD